MSKRTPYILLTFANPLRVPEEYLAALNRESALVYSTLEQLAVDDICDVNRIPDATVEQIFDTVEKWQVRKDLILFHYGGHATGAGLVLVDEAGKSRDTHAGGLAQLLGSLPHLQLVFLNGCSTQDQVQLLLEKGVRSVIATTAPIQDQMAGEFASRLYQHLAKGQGLGAAFEQARTFIEAKYGFVIPPPSATRGLKLDPQEEDSAFSWGLYTQAEDPDILNWRLPRTRLNRSEETIKAENALQTDILHQIQADISALEQAPKSGSLRKKVLRALLLIVGLPIALWLIWAQPWRASTFDLTLSLYADSTQTQLLEAGSVQFIYPDAPEASFPIRKGLVKLSGLASGMRGDTISLQISGQDRQESPLSLAIPRKGHLASLYVPAQIHQSIVSGTIRSREGTALAGARVRMGDQEALTDSLGDFSMSLAFPPGKRLRMRIIYQQEEVYNGEETVSSQPINILLR